MLVALLAIPLVGAAVLAGARGRRARAVHGLTATLTVATGLAVALLPAGEPRAALGGLLRVDVLSAWMIALIALVGGLAALEAPRYVPLDAGRRFYPFFHLFLFTMLLAVSTDDVGLMWVAVEGTTLASVFLVNFEGSRASLEAAYKYLIICSVGIGMAFVGTVLVYFAEIQHLGPGGAAGTHALRWSALVQTAPQLPGRVMELAFVFLIAGYGTKAGLAPMHTWLPDAHSEAPAPVSALMSGVLLSVGIYALLRFKPVVDAAAGPGFSRRILLAFGLASMGLAAAFLWTSRDYKRMLAYSSVEHMGIICLGLGFGGRWGVMGALLHIANHALAKSVLFLLSGRIRAAYGSPEIAAVRGLLTTLPPTGSLFLVAMLALMGVPPFGLFTSEVMIFAAGFQSGGGLVAAAGLALLVVVFGGMLRSLNSMLYGPTPLTPPLDGGRWRPAASLVAALLLLVLTGVAWPAGLAGTLERLAAVVTP